MNVGSARRLDPSQLRSFCSTRRTQLQVVFGRDRKGADLEDKGEDIVPAWGEEQPDWTDAPEQLDLLEEIWYEVCTQHTDVSLHQLCGHSYNDECSKTKGDQGAQCSTVFSTHTGCS